MLTMFARAVALYVLVILLLRLMGKRQIGQLQPFELVFTVLVADLAASPMSDVGVPLLYGVMPIAALLLCYALFSLLTLRCGRARALLSGRPAVLVRQGVVDEEELRRQGMALTELIEQARESGVLSLADVGLAVLEISGKVNVLPRAGLQSPTREDLGLRAPEEALPLPLVLDGAIQRDSLRALGRSDDWLRRELRRRFSLAPEDLLLCLLQDETFFLQKHGETRLRRAPERRGN